MKKDLWWAVRQEALRLQREVWARAISFGNDQSVSALEAVGLGEVIRGDRGDRVKSRSAGDTHMKGLRSRSHGSRERELA